MIKFVNKERDKVSQIEASEKEKKFEQMNGRTRPERPQVAE
jgi:hypothetical protein